MNRLFTTLVLYALFSAGASAVSNDLALVDANMGKASYAPNPQVILHPNLTVSPGRKTVFTGDSIRFSASGSTNPITWFFIDNASGATKYQQTTTSIVYQAGMTSPAIDTIEAWDGLNRFGRAYVNVITDADADAAGKAIIIAGTKGAGDRLWPNTDYLANRAYDTLLYKAFSKPNIHYLSPVPGRDIDRNGLMDDIDLETTYANAAHTFTNWANGASNLFVYAVDHGSDSAGQGYFRLNSGEILPAADLDAWLDQLQDTYQTKVIVLIDCCYSASIMDELQYTGPAQRIVIASSGANEPAYFIAGGLVSFSDAFFNGILLGFDLEECYDAATDAMGFYQDPAYYDNGGGSLADDLYVGATFVERKDIPQVSSVCGNQLLQGGTKAYLWADDVVSAYNIDRVWCHVVPPSHDPDPSVPVADIPEVDLHYNDRAGRYEGSYSGFSEQGSYKVIYYARDEWNSVSLPVQRVVIQQGIVERVILVAGGDTNAPQWPEADAIGRYAYHTLNERWFMPEAIQYLGNGSWQDADGDGSNDVDDVATLATLGNAITNWAVSPELAGPAAKLTLYLAGMAQGGEFQLNDTETLVPATLDSWLDQFQVSNAEVNVIMDFEGSGGYLSSLKAPSNRLVIASSGPGQPNVWASSGMLSFSGFFLGAVRNGKDLAGAFVDAWKGIKRASRRKQFPVLDEDADGYSDGDPSRRRHWKHAPGRFIGPAFVTGDDVPSIGTVMPDHVFAGTGPQTIWVTDVVDADGISNVWCVVTPPDFDGSGNLPETNLLYSAADGRYEAPFDFAQNGTYALTFYARDNTGELSAPSQAEATISDVYEIDDTSAQASFHTGATRTHTYHVSNDVDWIKFYASTDISAYEIASSNVSAGLTNVMTLYHQETDGSLTLVDTVTNNPVTGVAETFVDFGVGDPEGFYFIRMHGDGAGDWLPGEYELSVAPEIGGGGSLMIVAVDELTGQQAPSAVVSWNGAGGSGTQSVASLSTMLTGLGAGTYTVTVDVANGYLPVESMDVPGAPGDPDNDQYGVPRHVEVAGDEWRSALFRFMPTLRAEAIVRNAWSGERIAGARLEFTARSGAISNDVHNAYPNEATYALPWETRPDGTFPTNVLLPTVDWDVTVTATDYTDLLRPAAITNPAPGDVIDLGLLSLLPVDADGNNLADAWESRYGGGLDPDADPDGDGHDTRTEQRAGTDPTDPASVLALDVYELTPSDILLRWPVAPGRIYTVNGRMSLLSGPWAIVHGPVEALPGETYMEYDTSGSAYIYFRVGLQ